MPPYGEVPVHGFLAKAGLREAKISTTYQGKVPF
jgi:hypothetical protein